MKLNWQSKVSELFKTKGSKTSQNLEKAGIYSLFDLIWIFPLRVNPISTDLIKIDEEGQYVSLKLKIISKNIPHSFAQKNRTQLKNISILTKDNESGHLISLKWFNAYPSMVQKIIALNGNIIAFGKVSKFKDSLQIINPVLNTSHKNESVFREYPTINTVSGQNIKKLIDKIPIELFNSVPSIVPNSISLKMSLALAFKTIHGIELGTFSNCLARERIIYEELFNEQVALFRRRASREAKASEIAMDINYDLLYKKFSKKIPFFMTEDQKNTLKDIALDLVKETPMMRLIQGDVGCGKTIVAFAAAQAIIDNGKQVAMMVPTESLATQHYSTAVSIFAESSVGLLTSSINKINRAKTLKEINNGKIKFIIGTHSLIQDEINFKNLSLSIIDEQHKFGVNQRIQLTKKSKSPNTLLMTATPIPRSLCLTHYGDLDISIIKQKPLDRKKVSSKLVDQSNFQKFLGFLKTRLEMCEQVYVVAPAIEQNEAYHIQNTENVFSFFSKIFEDYNIQVLHGKQSPDEKQKVLQLFQQGKVNILVSTSVIEVGIDNPNATTMCVFGPERFGLSSLHQLRGRVGRGKKPGFFFMVEDKKIGEVSKNRLNIILNNTDGFLIAEEDLKIRGEGDVIGLEQSGREKRKISSLLKDECILHKVINDFNSVNNKSKLFRDSNIKPEALYTI